MGAQFSKTRSTFLRFFDIFGNAKKTCFHLPLFFMFFSLFLVFFWRPLGFFWRPFGAFVVSLAFWCHPFGCLWLAWALCGPSLLLFVVSLARLGCLWARGPLRECFLLHFLFFRWCWGCGLKVLVRCFSFLFF